MSECFLYLSETDLQIGCHIEVTTLADAEYRWEHGYYKTPYNNYCSQSRQTQNGILTFYIYNIPVGTYVIRITQDDYDLEITADLEITTKLKTAKIKTAVKAPKVTAKYKKSKYFKITVKAGKKAVKNLKLKVKVYTGKKYKTYTVKTNKKGIASLNTKKLKKGNHKVIITSANKKYSVSAKSNIKIK